MVDGRWRDVRSRPARAAAALPLHLRAVVHIVDAAAELVMLAIDPKGTVTRWTGEDPKAERPRSRL